MTKEYKIINHYYVDGVTGWDINDNPILTDGDKRLMEVINSEAEEGWQLSHTDRGPNIGRMAIAYNMKLYFVRDND
jgi:hypothetical protein